MPYASPRSLISAFVVRCLDSIIPILAKSKISRLLLVSVAEQASLSLTWWRIPQTGFPVTGLNYDCVGMSISVSQVTALEAFFIKDLFKYVAFSCSLMYKMY